MISVYVGVTDIACLCVLCLCLHVLCVCLCVSHRHTQTHTQHTVFKPVPVSYVCLSVCHFMCFFVGPFVFCLSLSLSPSLPPFLSLPLSAYLYVLSVWLSSCVYLSMCLRANVPAFLRAREGGGEGEWGGEGWEKESHHVRARERKRPQDA